MSNQAASLTQSPYLRQQKQRAILNFNENSKPMNIVDGAQSVPLPQNNSQIATPLQSINI